MSKILGKYFGEERVNAGRQSEFDLMKFFLIFSLAIVHTFVECSTDEQLDVFGLRYFFDSVVGGPFGSPVFIFSMGIGLAYSNAEYGPKRLCLRGVNLVILSFVLNFFRYELPFLVGYAATGDDGMYLEDLVYCFFGNDILQFAGLAMMFMAALRYHFRLSSTKIMGIAVLLQLFATFCNGTAIDNTILAGVLGYFVGVVHTSTEIFSDFPLFNWFLLYATGNFFGLRYKYIRDKEGFFRLITPISLFVAITIQIIEYNLGIGMMGASSAYPFYHISFFDISVCFLSVMGLLGVSYFLDKKLSDRLRRFVYKASRNITITYCIQWVLVIWVVYLVIYQIYGTTIIPEIWALVVGIILSIVSIALAHVYREMFLNRKKKG